MSDAELGALMRGLPAVDQMLKRPAVAGLLENCSRTLVTEAVRQVLDDIRQELRNGRRNSPPSVEFLDALVVEKIESDQRFNLVRVINATGVILHTNLGRAVLSRASAAAVEWAAGGYSNLEFDLESGERGSRLDHVVQLLTRITGAEDALVVNNNAGAVLLALSALAPGQEVLVSRGQLVEIGGSFRIPEIMSVGGARLVEVGTTNRTYLSDFENAITPETRLLLRVHTSNFRVVGFTSDVSVAELVSLGRRSGVPVMEDIGSGLLLDLGLGNHSDEPVVPRSLEDGADVVTFSGDKLLGGPQAGIIVGGKRYLAPMRKHPLMRALRIDKLSLAALEATLRSYLDPAQAKMEIPTLHALLQKPEQLHTRAEKLRALLEQKLAGKAQLEVRTGQSEVGGGSLPGVTLPTFVVTVKPASLSAQELGFRLRHNHNTTPVVARLQEGSLVLDVRTLLEGEEEILVRAMVSCLEEA